MSIAYCREATRHHFEGGVAGMGYCSRQMSVLDSRMFVGILKWHPISAGALDDYPGSTSGLTWDIQIFTSGLTRGIQISTSGLT